jgi:hypothetical protein
MISEFYQVCRRAIGLAVLPMWETTNMDIGMMVHSKLKGLKIPFSPSGLVSAIKKGATYEWKYMVNKIRGFLMYVLFRERTLQSGIADNFLGRGG